MNMTKLSLKALISIAATAVLCTTALPAQATSSYTLYPTYCLNNGWQTDKELTLYHDKDTDHRHLEWDIRHNTTTGEDYAVITGYNWNRWDFYPAGAMDIMPTVKTKGKTYTVRRVGDGNSPITKKAKYLVTKSFNWITHIKVKSGSTPVCIAANAFDGVHTQSIEFTDASFVTIGTKAFANTVIENMSAKYAPFPSTQKYGVFFNKDINDRDKLNVTIGDNAFMYLWVTPTYNDTPYYKAVASGTLQTSAQDTSSYSVSPTAFDGSDLEWIKK